MNWADGKTSTIEELIGKGMIMAHDDPRVIASEIAEMQQEMETAECHLEGAGSDLDESVRLVCEREECAISHTGPLGHKFKNQWTEELPDNCLPEFAVMRRAAHLRTHVDAP